jgi:hypothetical protein
MNYIKAVHVNLLAFVVIGAACLDVTSILKIWTVENIRYFIFLIPHIIDNRSTTLKQQNAKTCSLDIYITVSLLILLHVSVRKGASIRDST